MAVLVDQIHGVQVLNAAANWHPLSQPAAVFMGEQGAAVIAVATIHVGQGDCNAIVARDIDANNQTNWGVIAYFDAGGGCGRCASTNPCHGDLEAMAGLFDLELDPKIVLSHWDKDHYYGAMNAPDTHALEWLVPRQSVGAQCARFVRQLADVLCYPLNGPRHRFALAQNGPYDNGGNSVLYTEQAVGNANDRNLTGLSLTVVHRSDDNQQDLFRIIMPGDAPFKDIPSLAAPDGFSPAGEVRALFAYHHGSRTHFTQATVNAIPPAPNLGYIGFSYGLNANNANGFGHPSADAIGHYRVTGGWNVRQNTASELPQNLNSVGQGHDYTTGGTRAYPFELW